LENLIFRSRPDERNACDQWTMVKDEDDEQDYVVQSTSSSTRCSQANPICGWSGE
jgi:hypothetical protein